MKWIFEIFKIKPGEERMSLLLAALVLVTSAGGAVGGNATTALFFSRFGLEFLPLMYVILGIFTFITSLIITVVIGRFSKHLLYPALAILIGLALAIEWAVLSFQIKWFFAAIWLIMNVINNLQGLLVWGLAGMVCDTRQAKRLFPLFSAGGIFGMVIGGLLTQPLADRLHSENLLLVWAGVFFISFLLCRALIAEAGAVSVASSHAGQSSILIEMQRGYRFVRRSPIMQWVSYSAILFSICYFFLDLQFSRSATLQYPGADQLAGFLGLFQSITTVVALIVSLFLANRLFARFGIMSMLLLFPVIYLIGFVILSITAPFAILVSIRFLQMVWMQGVAGTAWQALFNVVPADQRDQVRTFVGGVPESAGTVIAGSVLVVIEQTLSVRGSYGVGLIFAAILVYIIWLAARAYGNALVEALRAGQPQMFFSEEEPFGGFRTDAAAVAVALNGLKDSDSSTRLVSLEILANIPSPEITPHLVQALADPDSTIRIAALRGLIHVEASSIWTQITACLTDPEPDVRLQAVATLQHLTDRPHDLLIHIEPLLADPEREVCACAARAMLALGDHPRARGILHEMATDSDFTMRIHALNALAECGDEFAFQLSLSALDDHYPAVRKAAVQALIGIDPESALVPLLHHLNDDDGSVRKALAEALGRIGPAALNPLLSALRNPAYEDAALMALEFLPLEKASLEIHRHALETAGSALHYHQLALGLTHKFENVSRNDGRYELLIESLQDKARRSGINSLRAVGLTQDREAVAVAIENLRSREASQRANALEVLESMGQVEIVRPLLALWESNIAISTPLPDDWLLELLQDQYSWLRACAVLVSADFREPQVIEELKSMSQSDSDQTVRDIATKLLSGENLMETLATLPLMERILFLRRVPIFADLPPADLKQLAAITVESVFADGDILARQGEPGDEMYIVVSGDVRVLITSENQKEAQEIARRSRGDYVGEMAVISREPRIATLVAAGAVRTLSIDQKRFEGILRERPEISLAMMRVLCQRLKEASDQMALMR